MQSLHWFIQYGPLSGEPLSSNYLRGDHLMEKLTQKGVVNGITSVLEGGHNWATADKHMRQTLPLHWSVLGPASVVPLRLDSVAKLENGRIRLEGQGTPLQSYQIEATGNLRQSFAPIGTVNADGVGNLSFEDGNASNFTSRFYRLKTP
jgi:hypothetical protein